MRAVSGVDRIVTQSPIVGVGFGVPCAASTVHDHILRMVYRESESRVECAVDQSSGPVTLCRRERGYR